MNWINLITKYTPYNEQEKKDKEIILSCITMFDDVLSRNNAITHITSSAFVVNKTKDKVLVVHHNIYNSWSWTGGHADGEEDLLAVAIKELKEETGIKSVQPISSQIFALDILPVLGHIKQEKYVSAHLHLSVAFLIEADENEVLIVKEDENSDVKWIPIDEMTLYSNEPHMQKVYAKIISKLKKREKM
ncbi:NUDIX hydrolase [Pelosinus sp. sgz500959]|uniref:NUDIX hydrolase n=1 Tax=Pelosinus sp. sgz500959 TaxID=3242472 RepID=UPI003670AE78